MPDCGPVSAVGDPLGVLGRRRPAGASSGSTASASASLSVTSTGAGQRVVLGLADQVGGDVHRVGGVVGEDRDLGRAGLGVDADHAACSSRLAAVDVDVARAR